MISATLLALGGLAAVVAPVVLACQVVQPGQQPVGAHYACWHPFILVYTGLPHMWHACHTASVAYILLLSVRCSRSRPERPARPLRYNPSGGPQTQARRIISIADCGDLASTRARCPRDIYAHGGLVVSVLTSTLHACHAAVVCNACS
jgi:hypothetical protein